MHWHDGSISNAIVDHICQGITSSTGLTQQITSRQVDEFVGVVGDQTSALSAFACSWTAENEEDSLVGKLGLLFRRGHG